MEEDDIYTDDSFDSGDCDPDDCEFDDELYEDYDEDDFDDSPVWGRDELDQLTRECMDPDYDLDDEDPFWHDHIYGM